ncbi:MAG: hypothetical protein NTV49_05230 [Kiritimatiellaeota bacterium]|nr:hypothetical protein [Kiritimatiellota bacterium]
MSRVRAAAIARAKLARELIDCEVSEKLPAVYSVYWRRPPPKNCWYAVCGPKLRTMVDGPPKILLGFKRRMNTGFQGAGKWRKRQDGMVEDHKMKIMVWILSVGCVLSVLVGCGREQTKTEASAFQKASEKKPDLAEDNIIFAYKYRVFGYLAVKYGIEQSVMEKLASDYLIERDTLYWSNHAPKGEDGPPMPIFKPCSISNAVEIVQQMSRKFAIEPKTLASLLIEYEALSPGREDYQSPQDR